MGETHFLSVLCNEMDVCSPREKGKTENEEERKEKEENVEERRKRKGGKRDCSHF